ncbi:MAG: squalene/phytoene synthase family protein [bacterium]
MNIFKNGRLTYYWSSRFFPKGMRDDVFKLYSFINLVHNFVDQTPSNLAKFEYIEVRWTTIKSELANGFVTSPLDDSVSEKALSNIAYIVHRHGCDPAWVDAFLKSMRWDIQKHQYRSLKDTLEYVYGTAEVVGLFVARILNLPEEALEPVRMQGRAMQYINFLRDLTDDSEMGRCYFPVNDIKVYGLKNLSEEEARAKPKMFADFVHAQLLRYAQWQTDANKGFIYIPKKIAVPLHTAVDSYNWTALQIKNDPLIVFEKKVKPQKRQVVRTVVERSILSKKN